MVYWITGRAKSGKTTLAKSLIEANKFKSIVLLDGDEVREHFPGTGYSDEERYEHIMRIARFAAILEKQGFLVIIALVSPRKAWRQEARKLFRESKLIYLPGGHLWEGTVYEEPDEEELRDSGMVYERHPSYYRRILCTLMNEGGGGD